MTTVEVDAVGMEMEEVDLLDDDLPMEEADSAPMPVPKMKSIISSSSTSSISRSRSPVRSSGYGGGRRDATNTSGNSLYVHGLLPHVTEKDLKSYFSLEVKVSECHVLVDPYTGKSRGFGLVTMDSSEDAVRCIKYLDRSILEGQTISVRKAKRKRASDIWKVSSCKKRLENFPLCGTAIEDEEAMMMGLEQSHNPTQLWRQNEIQSARISRPGNCLGARKYKGNLPFA